MTEPGAAPAQLQYRPALDGFRGVAILFVIFYHLRLLPGGSLGVDMFFVLSGLLITSILLKEWDLTGSIHLGRFYLRRFLRLGPALIAFVFSVYAVTHLLRPSLSGILLDRWAAAALLYVTNLLIAYGREYPLGAVSILWSLALEEQFYLIWPLCFRFLLRRGVARRRMAVVLLLVSALPALWRSVLLRRSTTDPGAWLHLYFAPDSRADPLLVGCALALFLAEPQGQSRAKGLAAVAGAMALGLLAATAPGRALYPYVFSIAALASAGVLLGAWSPGLWTRALGFPPLVWIGRLSYSLYLWHDEGLRVGSDLPIPGRLGVVLLLASTSYYLVERPFLLLKARRSPGSDGLAGPAPPRTWAVVGRLGAGLAALTAIVGFFSMGEARRVESGPVFQARARLDLSPDDPDRLAELSEALIQGGEFSEAVLVLDRAIALKPGDAGLLSASGFALRGAGRRAEAAVRLQQALRLDPREARAHFVLGELALDDDRAGDAIAAYSRSLEAAPGSAATHNALGIAYSLRGDNESAIRHFSEAARLDPEPSILANLERARSRR